MFLTNPIMKSVQRRPPPKVKRDERSVVEKNGWKHVNTVSSWFTDKEEWEGWFRTPYGSWRGKATIKSGKVAGFIFNPPMEAIRLTEQAGCFVARGEGWFWVHTNNTVRDLSSEIVEIENIICEGFRRAVRAHAL